MCLALLNGINLPGGCRALPGFLLLFLPQPISLQVPVGSTPATHPRPAPSFPDTDALVQATWALQQPLSGLPTSTPATLEPVLNTTATSSQPPSCLIFCSDFPLHLEKRPQVLLASSSLPTPAPPTSPPIPRCPTHLPAHPTQPHPSLTAPPHLLPSAAQQTPAPTRSPCQAPPLPGILPNTFSSFMSLPKCHLHRLALDSRAHHQPLYGITVSTAFILNAIFPLSLLPLDFALRAEASVFITTLPPR